MVVALVGALVASGSVIFGVIGPDTLNPERLDRKRPISD
jgi:hypothetical protein